MKMGCCGAWFAVDSRPNTERTLKMVKFKSVCNIYFVFWLYLGQTSKSSFVNPDKHNSLTRPPKLSVENNNDEGPDQAVNTEYRSESSQEALLSFQPCAAVQRTVKHDNVPPRPWCYI